MYQRFEKREKRCAAERAPGLETVLLFWLPSPIPCDFFIWFFVVVLFAFFGGQEVNLSEVLESGTCGVEAVEGFASAAAYCAQAAKSSLSKTELEAICSKVARSIFGVKSGGYGTAKVDECAAPLYRAVSEFIPQKEAEEFSKVFAESARANLEVCLKCARDDPRQVDGPIAAKFAAAKEAYCRVATDAGNTEEVFEAVLDYCKLQPEEGSVSQDDSWGGQADCHLAVLAEKGRLADALVSFAANRTIGAAMENVFPDWAAQNFAPANDRAFAAALAASKASVEASLADSRAIAQMRRAASVEEFSTLENLTPEDVKAYNDARKSAQGRLDQLTHFLRRSPEPSSAEKSETWPLQEAIAKLTVAAAMGEIIFAHHHGAREGLDEADMSTFFARAIRKVRALKGLSEKKCGNNFVIQHAIEFSSRHPPRKIEDSPTTRKRPKGKAREHGRKKAKVG